MTPEQRRQAEESIRRWIEAARRGRDDERPTDRGCLRSRGTRSQRLNHPPCPPQQRTADCLDLIDAWSLVGQVRHLGVEADVSSVLGSEGLITPAWLAGEHASPDARIDAEGWPLLSEVAGRVMFIVLNRNAHAQDYTHDFTSLDDRIMFANAVEDQFDLSWVW